MSETIFVPGPETARAYRDALGAYGTGVGIVTIQTPRGPEAITVNSFTSVSMEPPLVLWCPAKTSLRHDAFAAAGFFAFHVVSEAQLPLAQRFARVGDDFDDVAWEPNSEGAPAIAGCLARFDCRRHACHDAGDHTIVVGEVLQVTARPGKGLLFKRGQYGGFLEQS